MRRRLGAALLNVTPDEAFYDLGGDSRTVTPRPASARADQESGEALNKI